MLNDGQNHKSNEERVVAKDDQDGQRRARLPIVVRGTLNDEHHEQEDEAAHEDEVEESCRQVQMMLLDWQLIRHVRCLTSCGSSVHCSSFVIHKKLLENYKF